MDIALIVKLTDRAWAMEILSALHAGVPARQAPLIAATGAGRTAFGQSLQHLFAVGLLERNPGHGHPLRPEFRLTPVGEQVARLADAVRKVASDNADRKLLRRRWTMPVLAAAHVPARFSELKVDLVGITDRALSQSVDQLQNHGWLTRKVDVERKPLRPLYHVVNAGAEISRIIHAQGLRVARS